MRRFSYQCVTPRVKSRGHFLNFSRTNDLIRRDKAKRVCLIATISQSVETFQTERYRQCIKDIALAVNAVFRAFFNCFQWLVIPKRLVSNVDHP